LYDGLKNLYIFYSKRFPFWMSLIVRVINKYKNIFGGRR